jgi:signal peptidase II
MRRLGLLSLIAGVGVALDQLTKVLARVYLAPRPPIVLLGGVVRLTYDENPGAFLGLGSELPAEVRVVLFGVFAGLLLLGTGAYVLASGDLTPGEVAAVSLLVGGGLGNLVDRVLRDGRVTDFANVGIGRLRTGIFNLADVLIMAGIGWLLVEFALHPRQREDVADTA